MTVVLVACGGALGAVVRYLVDALLPAGRLPYATLLVNVCGAGLLGTVTAAAGDLPGWVGPAVATGVCGALSTWSTLGHELLTLLEDRRWRAAGFLAAAHLVLGVAAAVGAGRAWRD